MTDETHDELPVFWLNPIHAEQEPEMLNFEVVQRSQIGSAERRLTAGTAFLILWMMFAGTLACWVLSEGDPRGLWVAVIAVVGIVIFGSMNYRSFKRNHDQSEARYKRLIVPGATRMLAGEFLKAEVDVQG